MTFRWNFQVWLGTFPDTKREEKLASGQALTATVSTFMCESGFILTAIYLKTIKMVLNNGVFLITPDLSQGLRKCIHSIETVLTVLYGFLLTRMTEPPLYPLLWKEGRLSANARQSAGQALSTTTE